MSTTQFAGAAMMAMAGLVVITMSVQMLGFRGAVAMWLMSASLAGLACGGVYLLTSQ